MLPALGDIGMNEDECCDNEPGECVLGDCIIAEESTLTLTACEIPPDEKSTGSVCSMSGLDWR